MRASVLVLLVAATASFAFPPIPPPKAKKPNVGDLTLKSLEGTWTVVSYEIGRAPNARGVIAKTTSAYQTIVIKDGTWVQKRTLPNGGTSQTVPYAITLDASKSPPTFDLSTRPAAKAKGAAVKIATGTTRLGVVRLEGDRLTVSYSTAGRERPTSADGQLGVAQYRWVLQRAAKP